MIISCNEHDQYDMSNLTSSFFIVGVGLDQFGTGPYELLTYIVYGRQFINPTHRFEEHMDLPVLYGTYTLKTRTNQILI